MSAETLRRTATAIREDYCAAETDNGEDDPFMFAVADWLEGEADELAEALDALDFLGPPTSEPGGRFGRALAVANAYLQETP